MIDRVPDQRRSGSSAHLGHWTGHGEPNQTWQVELERSVVLSLESSLNQGLILNDQGIRFLTEREVARINSLKVVIYSDERPAPHFRVKCDEVPYGFLVRLAECGRLAQPVATPIRIEHYWFAEADRSFV